MLQIILKYKTNLPPIPPRKKLQIWQDQFIQLQNSALPGDKAELFCIKTQTFTSKLNKTHSSAQEQLFISLCLHKKNRSKAFKFFLRNTFLGW